MFPTYASYAGIEALCPLFFSESLLVSFLCNFLDDVYFFRFTIRAISSGFCKKIMFWKSFIHEKQLRGNKELIPEY